MNCHAMASFSNEGADRFFLLRLDPRSRTYALGVAARPGQGGIYLGNRAWPRCLDRADLQSATSTALAIPGEDTRSATVPIQAARARGAAGAHARSSAYRHAPIRRRPEAGVATLLLSRPGPAGGVAVMLSPGHNDAAIRLAQCSA